MVATNVLADLSQESRASLLDGPEITLALKYNGDPHEYLHQRSAAKHIVSNDRARQLNEQSETANVDSRPYYIVFPKRALAAGSFKFADYLEHNTGCLVLDIDLGHILPGFVMDVLDWYAKSLQSHQWTDFMDFTIEVADLEGPNKWYYYYIYVTMRVLGMSGFANALLPYLYRLVDHEAYNNARYQYGAYVHILRHLGADDVLVEYLARRHLVIKHGSMGLMTSKAFDKICHRFPHFQRILDMLLKSQGDMEHHGLRSEDRQKGIDESAGQEIEERSHRAEYIMQDQDESMGPGSKNTAVKLASRLANDLNRMQAGVEHLMVEGS